jgi:hypothetical protein
MRFSAKRLIGAGVIGIAALAAPISIAALTAGPTAVASNPPSLCSSNPTFDQICFAQTNGGTPDEYQYVPTPANGLPSAIQGVNIAGTCASPTGGGAPILSTCGRVYASPTYASTGSPAPLGTQGLSTGVGAVSPAWSIENKSGQGAEAIDFSPGTDVAVTGSSRLFTRAQIPITRKDSGVTQIPVVTVGLMEFDSNGAQSGLQYCTISGKQGTQITADTSSCNAPAPAGDPAPSPAPAFFQTVEVQDYSVSTSISVGGSSNPETAIFTLGFVVCGGTAQGVAHTAFSIGPVSATMTMTGGASQCKTYSSFSSTNSSVSFNGVSASPVQFVVHVTWPVQALCSPYADVPSNPANGTGVFPGGNTPVPGATTGITDAPGVVGGAPTDMCPVHQFTFDNVNFYDQAYCQQATAPSAGPPPVEPQQELCTVTKAYNSGVLNADGTLETDANGNPVPIPGGGGTQIVENWDGFIDWGLH